MGRWGLNEASGSSATDTSGNGVTGTLVGSPPRAAGFNVAGGTAQYITLGSAAQLRSATFTVELWFQRTGTGVGTSTGTGGILTAVPLITKGRAEGETAAADVNYFLGIDQSSGKLVADFEEAQVAQGGTSPSLNHPITGNTAIAVGTTWHHAAATYDGTTWNLYLDGVPDGTLAVGRPANALTNSLTTVGSALTTAGVADGFFAGVVDEVRIWSVARTAAQIAAAKNIEITGAQAGLMGRWGLNEGSGTSAADSSGNAVTGTLVGAATPSWVAGFPIVPTNTAPVAVADSYSTPKNTTLAVAAPGVLGNDTDADGDALTAILVANVAHGTLTLGANGSISYVPTAAYVGPDSFTYKANDGTVDANTVTVSLTVTPTNAAPVAVADSYSTPKNTTLAVAAPGVLGNDTDADGNPLTAILVANVAHGTLTLGSNGSISYVPTAAYVGPDSFTYQANDGTLNSNTVTVSLTVTPTNAAPVAVADTYSTPKNTTLTVAAPGVLGNDTDADGDTLTAILVANVAHGTLTLGSNGSISYVPTAAYVGPDSFTYKANDGALDSNTVTVSLTVTPTNAAPVAVADLPPEEHDPTVAAPGSYQRHRRRRRHPTDQGDQVATAP